MTIIKKITAMAIGAFMLGGVAIGNSAITSKHFEGLSANASVIAGSILNKISSTSSANFDKRIVQIKVYRDNAWYASTGFIIGDHTIATCAHSLYNNGYASKAVIYIGKCGNNAEKNNQYYLRLYQKEFFG